MTASRLRTPLLLFGLLTAIGLLFFSAGYFDDLSRQIHGTAPRRLTEEMVGVYTAYVMLPFAFWIARRFRIRRENLVPALLVTIAAALVYSVVHTTLNEFVRDGVSWVSGQGEYDYGIMFYRYPMEASKDVIYFLIIVGFVNYFDGLARARRTEIEAAELQTKLARAQLENLRLQLHPHFLFNTLNAISAVMYEDVAKADEMLAKLSDFLRTVLASSSVQIVSLDEELKVERMYVDIMTTRLEQRLSLNVLINDDAREAAMPFMLLQPLLENSIRHGMTCERNAIDITIAVSRENGSTVVEVIDDGSGYSPAGRRGHGLANVESRLIHTFGDASSFAIAPRASGGTHVTMRFPFARAGSAS